MQVYGVGEMVADSAGESPPARGSYRSVSNLCDVMMT